MFIGQDELFSPFARNISPVIGRETDQTSACLILSFPGVYISFHPSDSLYF